jgi:H+/Cl- antiporter ClcA
MLTKRFYISWIASSVIMFLLFYSWHGIFLNDFSRLSYPKEVFLIISAVVYLFIGFILAKAINAKQFGKHFRRKPVLRGLISGALCGLAFFMIATVVGISFSSSSKIANLLLDVSWQVTEQGLGGVVVGIVHYLIFDPSMLFYED